MFQSYIPHDTFEACGGITTTEEHLPYENRETDPRGEYRYKFG